MDKLIKLGYRGTQPNVLDNATQTTFYRLVKDAPVKCSSNENFQFVVSEYNYHDSDIIKYEIKICMEINDTWWQLHAYELPEKKFFERIEEIEQTLINITKTIRNVIIK